MENFIYETMLKDVSVCDELIFYHKNNVYEKGRGMTAGGNADTKSKVSTDVHVSWSNHPTITNFVYQLTDSPLFDYLKKYEILNSHRLGLKEPFNIQHYAPNEGYFAWHCERQACMSHQRALVWMTYLNDVDDGGTNFLYQNLTTPAKKGLTLIWPSHWTHTHKGQISNTKTKYIITGWFDFYDT